MSSLDIKIDVRKISRYSVGLRKDIGEKKLVQIVGQFAKYISFLYLREIRDTIRSSRYRGMWEPIEEKAYIDYIGTTPTSDLLSAIKESMEVKKIGYNYFVRFNPTYKYPGSRLPLIRVLKAIEYGTSKFNARPLLSRITASFRIHMIDYWKGFLAMKGVV